MTIRSKPAVSNEFIISEARGRIGLITLNRPKQLNALCDPLIDEIGQALDVFEADENIGCIVITGSEKAFAAGADIAAMKDYGYMDAFKPDYLGPNWARIRNCRKPIIAAVAGYALGGGCELAMLCDMIYAADTAKFGQPEIKLGVLPGAGGTQRLPRAVGKAKAMDLCLTARMMDAREAEQAGLVARVIPADKLVEETLAAAETIAGYSLPVIMMIKEAINRAWESPLAEGLLYERRVFQAAFALEDQKEGMAAFVEKRKPAFRNR
jgi:enoyl-CoA hydratase